MKKHLLYAICILFIVPACRKAGGGSNQPPIAQNKALIWDKKFGGTGYDFMSAQVQLPGGDYIIAGNTRSTDGDVVSPPRTGYDFWFARVSTNGDKVWSKTFGTNLDEYSTAAVLTQDGHVLATGYGFVNFQNTALLVKVNQNGDQVWTKSLSQSTDAKPMAIISSGDGNYLIAGYEKSNSGNREGWVAKVNNDGNIMWSKTFGGSGDDELNSIVRTSDGFAIAGSTKSSENTVGQNRGNYDGWVIKIDGSGNLIWSKTWGGSDADYLKTITQGTDGSLFAIGHSRSRGGDIPNARGGDDAWVMKINQAGTSIWSKNFGGQNEEYITAATATSDGGLIFAGHTNSNTFDVPRTMNDFGIWLLKVDGNGNKGVTSIYGADRGDEAVNHIIATSDGGFLVSGYQDVTGRGYDGLLIKIGPL